MPIHFNAFNRHSWIYERPQSNKSVNVKYLDLFTKQIKEVISNLQNFSGIIQYRNTDRKSDISSIPFMNFNYGSPAPYMCKLLPNDYGFNYFQPNDIYKNFTAENNIQSKLYKLYKNGYLTRYKQPANYESPKLPESFILIAMQNTGGTVWYRKNFTKLSNEIISWSRESKRNVLFKWHFGCTDRFDPYGWWDELEKSNYAFFDCRTPLNILIEKCNMFWTASSMSGIEALICNKPVAIFGETEYMEMATVANGPEDAINTKVSIDLEQWLTYYFRHYCINIYDKYSKDKIEKRITEYFEKGTFLNVKV